MMKKVSADLGIGAKKKKMTKIHYRGIMAAFAPDSECLLGRNKTSN